MPYPRIDPEYLDMVRRDRKPFLTSAGLCVGGAHIPRPGPQGADAEKIQTVLLATTAPREPAQAKWVDVLSWAAAAGLVLAFVLGAFGPKL